MTLDEEFAARLQAFSDKHCRGKKARMDLLLDMCEVFNLRLRVRSTEDRFTAAGPSGW